ncbi:glucuronate isomerase [Arenibacter sp. GZD96]|uniref:glucuronate isomerase n=1 Tax=Aurantibrevibacter litoralis TaxID=3106030 RepID=UPI002AFE302F|nr:glucuronate isomerase [Arenibacter sp. GZD-96]MEA1787102.1 glucuronate isomerase [Arenibacter sp. GZD-96]
MQKVNTKPFLTEHFLLNTKEAELLYHDYAKEMPIIDYHCHLDPMEIAEDRMYENITQLWISGDHYKWRAMRTMGISEKSITGPASDKEKFVAWAKTVPYTLRNPLFHWTQLELKRYFDIDELLTAESAETLYEHINLQLQQPEFSCRQLLSKMNVERVCTTDDPTDDLKHHKAVSKTNYEVKMLPAFRPDKAILIDAEDFNSYVDLLGEVADLSINTYSDLQAALHNRMRYFQAQGCSLCDHGLARIPFQEFTGAEIKSIFEKRRAGGAVSASEAEKYKTAVLLFLGESYHDFGWVQQFHLGALRNTNTRMLNTLGPNTGWDSIGDYTQAETLSKFLDTLDRKNKLAKTILYNLNPADNEVFASMIGNYNDGSIQGKMQWGSGWWFLDQKDGMEKQMNALSNIGLLSQFVGMLTDSRSFLSFPRHEYFRRILCNMLGDDLKRGLVPNDIPFLGKLVQDISYHNAKAYFDFK